MYKKDPTSFKIYKLHQLKPDVWRFNVSVYTSFGWLYVKGFRIRGNRIMSPSFHTHAWPTPIVNLPRDLRVAIRKRIHKQIRKVTNEFSDRDRVGTTDSASSEQDREG